MKSRAELIIKQALESVGKKVESIITRNNFIYVLTYDRFEFCKFVFNKNAELISINGFIEWYDLKLILERTGIVYTPQKTFNDYTWQEIQSMVKSGNHPFKVGDIKKINFRNEEHEIVIIGINHDGDNTITCQFKDNVFKMVMNKNNTKEGGFYESSLFKYLNTDFRKELEKVVIFNDDTNIFIPSEFEVFGENKYSKKEESDEQYEYYKDINNRIKLDKKEMRSRWWWLRSSIVNYSYYFVGVSSGGNASYSYAGYANGVVPCFII